jgi:hypothetical protein
MLHCIMFWQYGGWDGWMDGWMDGCDAPTTSLQQPLPTHGASQGKVNAKMGNLRTGLNPSLCGD